MGLMDFVPWVGRASDNGVQKMARLKEQMVHFFYIEGDNWEDRDFSPEALRTRVESIVRLLINLLC